MSCLLDGCALSHDQPTCARVYRPRTAVCQYLPVDTFIACLHILRGCSTCIRVPGGTF